MQNFTRIPALSSLALLIFLLLPGAVFAQQITSIHGKVVDSRTNEPLPYASVQLPEAKVGTRTDISGNFLLETNRPATQLRISYVGYTTQNLDVQPGARNEITVRLTDETVSLREIEVRPDKYRRRNNPAVDLIGQVFAHKDQNRKEGLDYYNYEAYEKLQFDLNNLSDKFRQRRSLRKFQFVFANVDTNQVNGKVALPVYLRERLLNVYYRRDPQAEKEFITAEQQTGLKGYLDEEGISTYLNSLYQSVDIYDANISLLTTQFVGPLSALAPTMYRFYIMDTVEYQGTRCADVFFAPRNKSDLAFVGNLLVALDSTYAVRKVQMGISHDINLNWVSDLHLEQDFDFFGQGESRRLMLTKDEITMDFQLVRSDKRQRTLEGGRVFGQVPYPLLVTHRANQTYSYQLQAYNLMNFLELWPGPEEPADKRQRPAAFPRGCAGPHSDEYPGKGTVHRSQRRHCQYFPAVPGGLCAPPDLHRPAGGEQMGDSGQV